MKIIATAGQLNTGKDEFSDYLVKKLNLVVPDSWIRSAFANAVKNTFCNSFSVDRAFIEKWKRIPEAPPGMKMPVRQALQFIGDGFRQIVPDIWIDIALRSDRNMIISDSRYINEAKAVKQRDGKVFIMYRPGFLNDDPNPSEAQIKPLVEFCKNNLQEGPLPEFRILQEKYPNIPEGMQYFDYFLVNDGTIQDLYSKIDKFVIPFLNDYA